MFADDVKIYHRIKCSVDCDFLQSQLDAMCRWSSLWGLSLNPAKCRVLTLTLRRHPVIRPYTLAGATLERVSEMRDLGVILDEKLTFSCQIDQMIRKANRALGLLIRSFQTGKHGKSFYRCDRKAIIGTYCAHVRSILEYGSVIWNGAAATHLRRLEHVQSKFLVWLCNRCHISDVSLQYDDLLKYFNLTTLAARRKQHDLLFIRNIHRQAIDSPFLLGCLPLSVPARPLRQRVLFHVPYARVATVQNGLFCRIPRTCNTFISEQREADVWHLTASQWKGLTVAYCRNRI